MKDLYELQLVDLPRLRDVWSKDPLDILSFRNLKLLKIHNCSNLTCIFSLSTALSLKILHLLEVKDCKLVEHIIRKAEAATSLEFQTTFPLLHTINLHCLTKLSSFCSTNGLLELPSLKVVEVIDCPNVKLSASTFPKGQDSLVISEEKKKWMSSRGPNSFQNFLGNKMGVPRLEELKVEWSTLNGNNPPEFLSRLKSIELTSFPGNSAILPATLLQNFTKLEKLVLSDALIEEINFDEHPGSFALLTMLNLSNLPNLRHLIQDYSQLFRNLEYLVIVECGRSMKTLVPFSVSFDNLIHLEVSKCDGLINLVTPKTAKSLVQLKRLIVKECKMVQEIVSKLDCELCFSRLEYLALDGLPCLASFCSGKYVLDFPSLVEAMVTECPSMKFFTEHVSSTPKLRMVKTGRRAYDVEFGGSLDKVVRALCPEKVRTFG